MTQKDRQFYATLIVIIFSLFIIVGLGHFRAEQLIKDVFVSDRMNKTLTEATAKIDIERLKLLRENSNDSYAQELRNILEPIRSESDWAGIYIVTKLEDEDVKEPWIFLLDSRSPEDPLAIADRSFMYSVPAITVEKAYWGKIILGQAYDTNSGARIGGFAPLGYGQGYELGPAEEYLAVAVLVVEYDADRANGFIYQTLHTQFGVLILGTAFIFLIWLRRKSEDC